MLKKLLPVLLALFLFVFATSAKADTVSCKDRYLTLVNPVRGRNLWFDKSIVSLEGQHAQIKQHDFPATWLLTFDALTDTEVVKSIKSFDNSQELGLFLEVSPDYAKSAGVIYPHMVAWDDPNAIFLSAYTRGESRKLIDELFEKFKGEFGYYPSSVGAWWIDSYSTSYMQEKYGVKIAMIVADQLTTDDYGVWGQWWGVGYVAKKQNILAPERDLSSNNLVVIQWAQRDFSKAFDKGPSFSNYSLQANDYTERGLDTGYFEKLTDQYLNCQLPVGQITVGLEVGMEGLRFADEYENQLSHLATSQKATAVTMSEFADVFVTKWPNYPDKITLNDGETVWELSFDQRINQVLGERVLYGENSFFDYFVPDNDTFLERNLNNLNDSESTKTPPYFLVVIIAAFAAFFYKNELKYWFAATLFLLVACFPLLKSTSMFGWDVFYGPVVANFELAKVITTLVIYSAFLGFSKVKFVDALKFSFLIPLSYGLDFLAKLPKYTNLAGTHYLGFTTNPYNLFAIEVGEGMRFGKTDLPNYIASSLIGFDDKIILGNPTLFFFVSPLVHIGLAFGIYLVSKKIQPSVVRAIYAALFILFLLQLHYIWQADPLTVYPSAK